MQLQNQAHFGDGNKAADKIHFKETVRKNSRYGGLHVPGHLNVVANSLSRTQSINTEWELSQSVNTEWELSQTEFNRLYRIGIQPEINLFASPVNNKLPRFMCPFPHPRVYSTDAFTADWNTWEAIYLFPPVNLLLRVTSNLMTFLGRALIIIPWRPTAP